MFRINIKNKIKIISINLLLMAYFFKGGTTSGFIASDLTVLAFLFIYILAMFRAISSQKICLFSVDLIIILFILWIGVGVLYSSDIYSGAEKFLKFVLMGIILIYIIRFFIKSNDEMYFLLKNFCMLVTIFELYNIINFFKSGAKIGRYAVGSIHPIPITLIGCMVIYCSLYFTFAKDKKYYSNGICIIMILISATNIIISASKGPVVSLILSLLITYRNFIKKINIKLVVGLLCFISILVYLVNYSILRENFSYFITRFIDMGKDYSTIERFEHYTNAINIWSKHFIFGIGTGGYEKGYPHNVFLELGLENGVLSVIILIFLVSYLFVFKLKILAKFSKNNLLRVSWGLYILNALTLLISWSYSFQKFLYYSIGIFIQTGIINLLEERDNNESITNNKYS